MSVGPVLPWRAASCEVLRDRLLVPAWAGAITLVVALVVGAHGIANVGAFALGAFALDEHRPLGRHRGAGPQAGDERGAAGRDRPHGPRQPAALRRSARAPRCGGRRDRAGHDGRATRRRAKCSSRTGESARCTGTRVTYLGARSSTSGRRPRSRPRVHGERRSVSYAPAISTYPNVNRGHRHALDPRHALARRLPLARLLADVAVGSRSACRSARWCCGCGSAA